MKFKTESCRHVERPSFRYSLHPEMTCMNVLGEKQNGQSAHDDRPHLTMFFSSREGIVDVTNREVKYILRKSGHVEMEITPKVAERFTDLGTGYQLVVYEVFFNSK